jgi:hypothetical protein
MKKGFASPYCSNISKYPFGVPRNLMALEALCN